MQKKLRIRQAENEYPCMVCGLSILVDEKYVRPRQIDLDKVIFRIRSREITWREKRPHFHIACFKVLKRWFDSNVPVIDNNDKEVQL